MPPRTPKPSAALATLRQLAASGMPGQMIREPLAAALSGLVPVDMVVFLNLDGRANIADGWLSLPDVLPSFVDYMVRFHNSKEGEAYTTFRDFVRSGAELDLLHRCNGRLLKTEIYNEVWRKSDTRYILRAALREGPLARGCIMLSRVRGAQDFTLEQTRRIRQAIPLLAHALYAEPAAAADGDEAQVAEGVVICNERGRVEHLSPEGRFLLHEAADAPLATEILSDPCYNWARPLLAALIADARRLASGHHPGGIPAADIRNRNGRYILRACRLFPVARGAPDLYAVSIRRYLPSVVCLLRSPAVQALPAREKEACLLLAQGLTAKEIAARMGISDNGAVYHIRSLYARLDISRRDELVGKLLDRSAEARPALHR